MTTNDASRPVRVQLRRTKGWRIPPNTVSVARPGRWGNKFRIGDTIEHLGDSGRSVCIKVDSNAMAVELYREWLRASLRDHPAIMRQALDELRGKNLACWCRLDQPCHAEVLLDYANS